MNSIDQPSLRHLADVAPRTPGINIRVALTKRIGLREATFAVTMARSDAWESLLANR